MIKHNNTSILNSSETQNLSRTFHIYNIHTVKHLYNLVCMQMFLSYKLLQPRNWRLMGISSRSSLRMRRTTTCRQLHLMSARIGSKPYKVLQSQENNSIRSILWSEELQTRSLQTCRVGICVVYAPEMSPLQHFLKIKTPIYFFTFRIWQKTRGFLTVM